MPSVLRLVEMNVGFYPNNTSCLRQLQKYHIKPKNPYISMGPRILEFHVSRYKSTPIYKNWYIIGTWKQRSLMQNIGVKNE